MSSDGDGFLDPWLKWGWATRRAAELKSDLDTWSADGTRQEPISHQAEYDARRHCIIWWITESSGYPDRFGLQLGEVVHGYRSCLDHLAWALVKRGTEASRPDSELTSVYYPLATNAAEFTRQIAANNRSPGKLPGVRRADLAIIRRYQPYSGGQRKRRWHCFTALHGMSNKDKHQTIQPVMPIPTGGAFDFSNPRDCEITRRIEKGRAVPLAVGTELTRVYVRKTGPRPRLELDYLVATKPTIPNGIGLYDWLDTTSRHIFELLNEFSGLPPQVRSLAETT